MGSIVESNYETAYYNNRIPGPVDSMPPFNIRVVRHNASTNRTSREKTTAEATDNIFLPIWPGSPEDFDGGEDFLGKHRKSRPPR